MHEKIELNPFCAAFMQAYLSAGLIMLFVSGGGGGGGGGDIIPSSKNMCSSKRSRHQICIVTSVFDRGLFEKRAHGHETGKYLVYKCLFESFPLQKPQAGITELEWWVEANA